MKKLTLLLLAFLPLVSYSQVTPSYHSYNKLSFETGDYKVTDYYIPLDKNINDSSSALFIAKKPTREQLIIVAITEQSDSLVITKMGLPVYMIKLSAGEGGINVTDLKTGQRKSFALANGDITANRAIEIAGSDKDKGSKGMRDGVLYYNKKQYKIVSNEVIKEQLSAMLEKGIAFN